MIYLLSIDHPHGHLTAGSFRLLLNALIGGANVLDLLYWIRQANLEIVLSLFLDFSYTIKIEGSFLQEGFLSMQTLSLISRKLCLWRIATQGSVGEIFSTWRLDPCVSQGKRWKAGWSRSLKKGVLQNNK